MKQILDKILKTIRVPSDIHDCVIQAIERVKKETKVKDKEDEDTEGSK